MNREICPECKNGYLYGKKDGQFAIKRCFVCGYYWNDSQGYTELSKRLFKEYFPKEVGWLPSDESKHLDDLRRRGNRTRA